MTGKGGGLSSNDYQVYKRLLHFLMEEEKNEQMALEKKNSIFSVFRLLEKMLDIYFCSVDSLGGSKILKCGKALKL